MTFLDKWKRNCVQVDKKDFWTIIGFTTTTSGRKKVRINYLLDLTV